MFVFEWIMAHLDLVLLTLTMLLNLSMLGSWVLRAWQSGRTEALSKWLQMLEAAREFEAEAEGFVHYTAAEKLNYVLSRLRTLSAELNLPFEEEKLTEAVEKDIAFSKVVNTDKNQAA